MFSTSHSLLSLLLLISSVTSLPRRAGRHIRSVETVGTSFAAPGLTAIGDTYPANEYEYAMRRDLLMEAERMYTKQEDPTAPLLSPDEQIVNHYLAYLKWREYTATKSIASSPSRGIETQLDHIESTEIYKALKSLPKGGNMHSHENHQLSKAVLFDIVWASADFKYLHMLPPNHPTAPWSLDFFVNPPFDDSGVQWHAVNSSSYTKDEILSQQTLLGLLTYNASIYPTDSGLRWQEINPLWTRCSDALISNIKIKPLYLQALYEQHLSENVIYVETRACFCDAERLYYMDPNPTYSATNGKVYYGDYQNSSDIAIDLTLAVVKNFTQTNPNFIGHKRIVYTFRQLPYAEWESEMNNTVRLFQKYPDHIVGYDTVGEEDAGYSHLHYLQSFLKLYSQGQSTVPLYLHSSETNWPDDLIASELNDDPVATLQNSYDVLLLGTRRIGHGAGFIKHPYLLEILRQKNIALEICLVSNQMLAFFPDLRNHPGIHYYRSGIPIVFGADDPGTFGYNNFTVDWYEAYMAWGLDLLDLKQIAINSLNYSAMSPAEKTNAIQNKWTPMWNIYIQSMKSAACARNYTAEGISERRTPSFGQLLPTAGPRAGGNWLHVFGRNFERAICKETTLACRFDNTTISTQAAYVSTDHVMCMAPNMNVASGTTLTVNVDVRLDGLNWIPTNLMYTYAYDVITTTPTQKPQACNSPRVVAIDSLAYFLATAVAFFGIHISFRNG